MQKEEFKVPEVLPQRSIRAHVNSIESVAVSPLGTQFATASHDKLIKLWDVEKGSLVSTMTGHKEGVWSVEFSKDGKTLLSGSPDSTICVWDVKASKPSKIMSGHRSKVYIAKYNENDLMVGSGGDRELIVWDMRKGTIFAGVSKPNPDHIVYALQWSKNGEYLATSESGAVVTVYQTAKYDAVASSQMESQGTRAYAIDANFTSPQFRNKFYVSTSDKMVKVYKIAKESKELRLESKWVAHCDGVKSLSLSPDFNLLATSGRDGSIYMWESRGAHRHLCSLVGHSDNVSQIAWFPEQRRIVSCSWDQKVNIYAL